MSNIVDSLERLGRDAVFHRASLEERAQALADSDLDAGLREAILRQDSESLRQLLGVHGRTVGIVYAPMDEESDEEESEKISLAVSTCRRAAASA